MKSLSKDFNIMSTSYEVKRWLKGIPYEVAFWSSWYSSRRNLKKLYTWSLYGKQCYLPKFDLDAFYHSLVESGIKNPLIADVGCGMSYNFGNIIDGEPREVKYVDALAPFYNRILDNRRIDRPRINFGMVEGLTATLPQESTNFIHVSNALDHCADPIRGLSECLAALKVGGVLYTLHFVNEAEAEQYRGFHQFNLTVHDGHLFVWNPQIELDVTDRFGKYANISTYSWRINDKPAVIAVFRKTNSLPESIYSPNENSLYYSELLSEVVLYFHNTVNSLSYQLLKWWWFPTTRIIRCLPYGFVTVLKKLLHKFKKA